MTNGQDIQPLYLHPHHAANEPVTLHAGPVVLRVGAQTSAGATSACTRDPASGAMPEAISTSSRSPVDGRNPRTSLPAGGVADALVKSVRMAFEEGKASSSIEAGISRFETGRPPAWRRSVFRPELPRFPDTGPQGSSRNRVSAEGGRSAGYVDQHNRVLPHSAFRGQTPDEMYFGTGSTVPADLKSGAAAARRARRQANRSAWCESCPSTNVAA